MAGQQKFVVHSLRWRLSLWLSLLIVTVVVATALWVYQNVFEEASEQQDQMLTQVAALINTRQMTLQSLDESVLGSPVNTDFPVSLKGSEQEKWNEELEEARIVAQPLPPNRDTLKYADGFHTRDIDGITYRLLIKTTGAGKRFFVAQAVEAQHEMAEDTSYTLLPPLFAFGIILLLVVNALIAQMLTPLQNAATRINHRDDDALEPIDTDTFPDEVIPFVHALNRLFERVKAARQHEKQFLANAAHELRTPLAALSLQAERVSAESMDSDSAQHLRSLKSSIARTCKLVDQLLTLARTQRGASVQENTFSLAQSLRDIIADSYPLAEHKHIDLAIQMPDGDITMHGYQNDVAVIIKNLVDNAIRYTPQHGSVEIRIEPEQDRLILTVSDSGPGIPLHERENVFKPFYRIPGVQESGSGLGLSIVQSALKHMHGQIELSTSELGGLQTTLTLPCHFDGVSVEDE